MELEICPGSVARPRFVETTRGVMLRVVTTFAPAVFGVATSDASHGIYPSRAAAEAAWEVYVAQMRYAQAA